ncbi:putative helicase [Azospirillum baldaniorum]|uniref:DEAD/DEAH box helicase n=1 Tax=Azospirillum baldaniorum TaxID=1064539 RepID=UPI0011A83FE4|nr:type ISP restriction/modification enzyme [Azospirillum baldaniorum]TWA52120.1 putative helicase [Azospirillum baldaniorum]
MSHADLQHLLSQFRELSSDERGKGRMFERLIANYMAVDPQYEDLLESIWLWEEWPDRWGADVGIDLVAKEKASGDYWAIQCKFFDPGHTIEKGDIDSFLSASGKKFTTNEGDRQFARRFVVSTTDKWNRNAESAIEGQTIPVSRISMGDLAGSPIDWSQFSLSRPDLIRLQPKKTPLPHQDEAISAVLQGFQDHDRGKLIMACGTGKTFTSLRLMERIVPETGRVLFLAPSISLVAQTLREWTAQATDPIHAFVVCSDSKVGRDEEDLRTHDLAFPATTDARKLAKAAQALTGERRTVVFSTYQSIQVVADSQKAGLGNFDLIICDEAHRTTGLTLPLEDPSDFVKVHHNHVVRAAKRLYMTATPRIYADASKTKADQSDAVLYSMDEEETFGPEFYRLGFGKAVERDLLSEYKVLIVAVEQDKMGAVANSYNKAYKLDDKKAIDINFATKIIGSWKGLSKQGLVLVGEDGEQEAVTEDTDPMRRAVAFSKSIKASQQMTETFGRLAELYSETFHGDDAPAMIDCRLQHVDGTMNALQRTAALDWLKDNPGHGKCRILSNARCLSEGIDVPALDAVVFFDTRESIVDIVQSVGRVMRKADGKRYGYIILPVCIPSKNVADYNAYIEGDPQFRGIWKVIKALRAHDESLVDEAEFRRKIKVVTGDDKSGENQDRGDGESLPLDFPALPIDAINEAVYAAIPKKLGDREYWSEWAKSVGTVAERLISRIESMISASPEVADDFARFVKGLQDTLNPAVSRDDAVEMLAQHILTLPVFQALFAGTEFPENNAVGKALQGIVERLDAASVGSETEGLEKFYSNVRERISLAKSDKSKQDIIRNLYDTFFHNAFPRMAERLGIVYTPVPVVDFILKSADAALRKHFGQSLADRDVQILDPFSGTGTFLVRLIQSGLLNAEALQHKYGHELHANELVLLAYYIATVNIETAYHGVIGEYRPFEGMVLVDTFQMTEEEDLVDKVVLPENNVRVERQLIQPIRVVIGNPPYSAQQDSESDNNKNINYPTLDGRIRNTYAACSKSRLPKNLYDSYIRAIRWASDRIEDRGIVAFVTNGSFLDANNMDGVRKCLNEDYSHLYVFNLRGDARTQGEDRRKEGGGIFNEGSRTPVAITIMVKDPAHAGPCKLYYHDIGDYLSQEEKLAIIEAFGSIEAISWQSITPNTEGDWVNQRDPAFEGFIPLGSKEAVSKETVFSFYSYGVVTNRDHWVYSSSKEALEANMRTMIDVYNQEVDSYDRACKDRSKADRPKLEEVVDADPRRISWTRALKADAGRLKRHQFEQASIVCGSYRPFSKQWMYFNSRFNEMVYLVPSMFPTPNHKNIVISSTGVADRKGYSALVANEVPNMHLTDTGQCFPLYWYEKLDTRKKKPQAEMFAADAISDADGYVRHDGVSDWALSAFRHQYGSTSISKEDIFWYVYGILHSPEYKTRFAADLKKMVPRIPFAADFWAFCNAGRALGEWHLNYDTVEPYPVKEEAKRVIMEPEDYRVHKMAFGKKGGQKDQSVIIYNPQLVLSGIPLEAYGYVVNGKSAIEWVMERYAWSKHKESGIVNDPNDWSEDPRYIVDLLRRVVRVSVESVRIIQTLPSLEEAVSPLPDRRAPVACV